MKKLIILLTAFLFYVGAKAQTYTPVPGYWSFQNFKITNIATLPGDTIHTAPTGSISIKNGSVYIKLTAWTLLSSGGGGSASWPIGGNINDQTDLINLLNAKLAKSDTAAMLSPYALKVLTMKYTDSGAMLAPYLRISNFTPAAIGLGNLANSLQVINAGGLTSMAISAYLSLPSPVGGPKIIYTPDTNVFVYNTGSSYVRIGGSGSGGAVAADSSVFVTRTFGSGNYYPKTGNPSSFLTAITGSQVTTALGFTPYNATNPNGYITGNQNITYTSTGDIVGTASGSTALSTTQTVTGLKSIPLPTITSFGNLKYIAGAPGPGFVWDSAQTISSNTLATIDSTSAHSKIVTQLLGLNSVGDGAGGDFYYNPTSTATAVNGMIISIPGRSGRLIRLYQPGAVNVMWFGAKGDGTTLDDAAFQSAVNYSVLVGARLIVPNPISFYRVHSGIKLPTNTHIVGQDMIMTKIIQDSNTFDISVFLPMYNSHDGSIENLNIICNDTATAANKTGSCIRVIMDSAFDHVQTRVTHDWAFKNIRMSGYKGKTAGLILNAHRSGYGGEIYNILTQNCLFDTLGVSGWAVIGEGGVTKSKWYHDITVLNCRSRHTGYVDNSSGFGFDFAGQGENNVVNGCYVSDAVPIAFEFAGPSKTQLLNCRVDSSQRNNTAFGSTVPFTFDCNGSSVGFAGSDNVVKNFQTLDSMPGLPLILNQRRYTSEGVICRAYTSGLYIDTVQGASFTGDKYYNTGASAPYVVWLRQHTSNVNIIASHFTGVTTQAALVLAQDTAFNNIFDNCTFFGEKDSSTLISQSRGAFNNIVTNSIRASNATILYSNNYPQIATPAYAIVVGANGAQGLAAYGTGSRIAALDSLAKSAKGIQIAGNNIVPQTADSAFAGFMTALVFRKVDSMYKGQLSQPIPISHPGSGIWSATATTAGDSLIAFNLVGSAGILVTRNADSSRNFAADPTVIATLSGTQTLTNKTLTSPKLNSSSTSGFVWTATGTDGSGAWAASSGGAGSQNLSLGTATSTTQPVNISGGTGVNLPIATHFLAGLISAASQSRIDSSLVMTWSGKGKKMFHFSNTVDTATWLGMGMTGSKGLSAVYTGTADSASWDVQFTLFTAAGDMLVGGSGGSPTKVTIGPNGSVWGSNGTTALWVTPSTGGTETKDSTGPLPGFFTAVTTNPTTTPVTTFSYVNAPAQNVFGSVSGGTPGYISASLLSGLFANTGTSTTFLRGNATGNLSFAAPNLATDVTGLLNSTSFPAVTGDISITAGTTVATIGSLKVTNAQIANGTLDLANKVTGILAGANGGTGAINIGKTITLAGNFVTSGANALTLTTTAATNVTLPTSGTLLATNGNGSSLTNIVTSLSGTANQVLVSTATGTPVLSLPQSIAAGSSPTFTSLTLSGLAGGAVADNIVTISGGVLRSTTLATLGIFSNTYTPTFANTSNVSSLVNQGGKYTLNGNQVDVSVGVIVTPSASGLCTATVTLPIATSSTTQNYIGSGTGFENSPNLAYLPVMVTNIQSTTTATFSFVAPNTDAKAINIHFMYSL